MVPPGRRAAKPGREDARAPHIPDRLTTEVLSKTPEGAAQPARNRGDGPPAGERRRSGFPAPGSLKPSAPFVAQLISQDQRRHAVAAGVPMPPADAGARLPVPARRKADLAVAQRRHFEQVNAYRKTESMAAEFIIRRYRLAADFQGVMLADISTVSMTV
ncbi:MAG: hypothetical protein ACE5GT_08545 [Rhodospirillales bacterium]